MRIPILFLLCVLPLFSQQAVEDKPGLTLEQKEQFLQKAKLQGTKGANKGITGTVKATLTDGTITHHASIQTINEDKSRFEGTQGTELNFRDTYLFNIAAYRLGRMLGLEGMIPPSVSRPHSGTSAAWTWWVDDVVMDEGERLKKKTFGPDKDRWGRQVLIMRVFDQLIYNTDRNVANSMYDKNWNLWMIDHTRAFRLHPRLMNPKILDKCDRQLLASMKTLTPENLKAELGDWLRPGEIKALLQRRDLIVKHFESGGPSLLYDFLPQR